MKNSDQISFASNRLSIPKYKIVLVGEQNAGKSSIIIRYIRNDFDRNNNPTIGIDFTSKNLCINDKNIRLQLWDTAGQQRFRSLIPSYLKDCNIALVVYDVTSQNCQQTLPKWIDFIKQSRGNEANIYIVGNKLDLQYEKRQQSIDFAKQYAEKQNLGYYQVSAKSGDNINEMFEKITQKLITRNNSNTATNKQIKQQDGIKGKQNVIINRIEFGSKSKEEKISLQMGKKKGQQKKKYICC